jgi:hypothetical protein
MRPFDVASAVSVVAMGAFLGVLLETQLSAIRRSWRAEAPASSSVPARPGSDRAVPTSGFAVTQDQGQGARLPSRHASDPASAARTEERSSALVPTFDADGPLGIALVIAAVVAALLGGVVLLVMELRSSASRRKAIALVLGSILFPGLVAGLLVLGPSGESELRAGLAIAFAAQVVLVVLLAGLRRPREVAAMTATVFVIDLGIAFVALELLAFGMANDW